jgi:hypothetical protein
LPTSHPTTLDVDYHRHAGLPSCVTPVNTLTYCRFGSRAPPSGVPEGTMDGFGRLASPGSVWAVLRRYGNINPLSIDYACRPRLRSRLTQGGLAWPWNPCSFGGRVSHPSFATHACILTRVASTAGLHRRFTPTTPYAWTHKWAGLLYEIYNFGGVLEPRYIVGAESLDQ